MDWRRPTAVAGTFYPRDENVLRDQLATFCGRNTSPEKATAIIAPHAGYVYSGEIAGSVYGRVQIPDCVVILCPNHSGLGPRVSLWTEGSWETPFGDVPIDLELAQALLTEFKETEGDQEAHLYEHAIEVHLPFLKWLNPNVRIVPIVLGALHLSRCQSMGDAIARVISRWEEPVLILASTDMSHYVSSEEASRKDASALKAIESVDPAQLYAAVVENEISMCGFVPTTVALQACRALGKSKGEVLRYGDSSLRSGDKSRVVAYASAQIL